MVAFLDTELRKYGKCSTTSRVVPDMLMLPRTDWYMISVFLMLMESPRLTLIRFCKEVKDCLKLFCRMCENGIVISIPKVYNGSLCHFRLGLETTHVEKFPIEPVVSATPRRRSLKDRVYWDV